MCEQFMYRFIKALTIFLFFSSVGYSQQDPMVSHFMFNNMTINPGFAGGTDEITATLLHRSQWVGIDKAPQTSIFNVHSPFKLFKQNHGVGISITNDVLGFNTNLGMNLAYAYRIIMNNGAAKLSFGISGGFQNNALSGTWVPVQGQSISDAALPQSNSSAMAYDIAFGVFYKTENVYLGASATHLSESAIIMDNAQVILKRHYHLTAGYMFLIPNSAFEVQPSVLISSDAVSSRIDVNTIVQYNKKLWGGVTFRPGISLTGLVGIQMLNGIKIGYGYDFGLNDLQKVSSGSHEIMVSYGFSISKDKIPHKYRSIRFL